MSVLFLCMHFKWTALVSSFQGNMLDPDERIIEQRNGFVFHIPSSCLCYIKVKEQKCKIYYWNNMRLQPPPASVELSRLLQKC